MEAGITDHVWLVEEIVQLIDSMSAEEISH